MEAENLINQLSNKMNNDPDTEINVNLLPKFMPKPDVDSDEEEPVNIKPKCYGQDVNFDELPHDHFFTTSLNSKQSILYLDRMRSSMILKTKDIKRAFPASITAEDLQKRRLNEIEKIDSECDFVVIARNLSDSTSETHVEHWIFCHSFLACAGSVVFQKWYDAEDKKRLKRNHEINSREIKAKHDAEMCEIREKTEIKSSYVILVTQSSNKCWSIYLAYVYTGVLNYTDSCFSELVEFANTMKTEHFKTALVESLKNSDSYA
jgi:hypothetical protein